MSARELKHSINQAFNTVVHHIQSAEWLYLYDDSVRNFTYLETHHNGRKSLCICNHLRIENAHYCVDGGLIPYGQETYGNNFRKRCDSLLVTDSFLFLIELKLNIDPTTPDKTKWDDFATALNQISQFYQYLISIIPNFQDVCRGLTIIPFIGY